MKLEVVDAGGDEKQLSLPGLNTNIRSDMYYCQLQLLMVLLIVMIYYYQICNKIMRI